MRYGDNIKRYEDRERSGRKYCISWHEYDDEAGKWVYDWCLPCCTTAAHLAIWFDSQLDAPFILEEIKPM